MSDQPWAPPTGDGAGSQPEAPQEPTWWRRKLLKFPVWVWILIAVFVAGGIGTAFSEDDALDTDAGAEESSEARRVGTTERVSSPSTEPEPTDAAPSTEATEPTRTEPPESDEEISLADEVWEGVERNFPGGIPASSLLYAVTDVEDLGAGTIRVYVQLDLDDDERDRVALAMFNLGGFPAEDLHTVVVRDVSGIDSNHSRR